MRVLIVCLLSALLAGLNADIYAQPKLTAIKGKVFTGNNAPATAATVVLLKYRDSSIVSSAIAGKNGAFQFLGIKPASYWILVTAVGFKKSYNGPYIVAPGKTNIADDIYLISNTKQLKEVSVVGSKPAIEVKPGKVILYIQNSLQAQGNSAYDVLRQSVGVRVDNSNNVSIVGKQNALITIDGKPANLSGDDLISFLKGMQSNTIDYIELITSGSARYDAAGGGIINIVLKKGKNIGTNGTVTATAGYGRYYKSNEGVIFNDRTSKFNLFGSFNHSDDKTFHDFVTDRSVTGSDYYAHYKSVQTSDNNNFGIGTDYFLSPGHTIGLLVNGIIRKEDIFKDDDLMIFDNGSLNSTIIANSKLTRNIRRLNYNVNYSGKLDKAGKTLSADINYTAYNRGSAEYIANKFYDSLGNAYQNPLLEQNVSPSNIRIWLSRVDFSDPLSKNSKLDAGIKFSDVVSKNNLTFGPLVNGQYQSDPSFSDRFLYRENVNSAYLTYENRFDKLNLTTGLRAEQTIETGTSVTAGRKVDNNYLDFFPQLLLAYKYDDKHNFSFSYNRGIKRPLYEEINPFLYYVDVYDYRKGNPNLKPQYTSNIELSYTYNKTFLTTLYSNTIKDAFDFNYYEQNDSTKVNVKTQKNFGKIYNYGVRFFAPVVFTNWWRADFSLDASYQRYRAYPINGNLDQGTQDIIFSSVQHFAFGDAATAEASGSYESPTFFGITKYKATYAINAGIGKQLFNKRGSLKLNASDIFNTLRDMGRIRYQNLHMSVTDKRESQILRLTFTYNFGKTSVKASSPHHTGNEDEEKRINAGNN